MKKHDFAHYSMSELREHLKDLQKSITNIREEAFAYDNPSWTINLIEIEIGAIELELDARRPRLV